MVVGPRWPELLRREDREHYLGDGERKSHNQLTFTRSIRRSLNRAKEHGFGQFNLVANANHFNGNLIILA